MYTFEIVPSNEKLIKYWLTSTLQHFHKKNIETFSMINLHVTTEESYIYNCTKITKQDKYSSCIGIKCLYSSSWQWSGYDIRATCKWRENQAKN